MPKRRPKSPIELLIDKLTTADLRLRLVDDLGAAHRDIAIEELTEVKVELEGIIAATKKGVYNG